MNKQNEFKLIFTGRNEVVAKVMFLQACVCPRGGGVSASVHAWMPCPPSPDQAEPDLHLFGYRPSFFMQFQVFVPNKLNISAQCAQYTWY